MTPTRVHIAEFARLLNSAKQPIYVLDEDFKLVFLNRACQEWLQLGESLLGRRAFYSSIPTSDPLDEAAAALCPPPQVFSMKCVGATVAKLTADGPAERRANFFPLGLDAEDVLGIVVVVDAVDAMPEASQNADEQDAEPSATMLHERIRRFRHDAAGRFRADRLIGQGHVMQLARQQVEVAAATRASVLLVGPSGSGRQRLAAAIHYGHNRQPIASPLISLDCPLLGSDLFEAMHQAMAKIIAVEGVATSGSLLFHCIDELAADMQTELAAQLPRYRDKWRLLASAGETLVDLTRRGNFRPDLAAAFSTITIVLPPLAQRREDLPLLAQLFLEEINAIEQRQVGGFTPAALDLFDAYPWPGNLDELLSVVAEAYRRSAGREIDVADLPDAIRWHHQAAARPKRPEETIVLDEYLARVERELIRRALTRAKGNKARAARLLGLTRPRLYRRMVQLGLEES